MPNVIRITIQEEPVAKGRPRVTFQNGKAHTYTPEKTQNAQEALRLRFLRYQDRMFPQYTPVRLTISFRRARTKWARKVGEMPVRKPDLDNFLKCALDSMNGVLVYDDSQITTIRMTKRWADTEQGYITIKLEEDKINGGD